MTKFSSPYLHSTYFIVDSDLLLKTAPPIEQTHYFQTCQIRPYDKYIIPQKKSDKFNKKGQKQNYYSEQEIERLDEQIMATKKRLEELISQKNQRMKQQKLKNKQAHYYKQFDFPENWYYQNGYSDHENSQNQQKNYSKQNRQNYMNNEQQQQYYHQGKRKNIDYSSWYDYYY